MIPLLLTLTLSLVSLADAPPPDPYDFDASMVVLQDGCSYDLIYSRGDTVIHEYHDAPTHSTFRTTTEQFGTFAQTTYTARWSDYSGNGSLCGDSIYSRTFSKVKTPATELEVRLQTDGAHELKGRDTWELEGSAFTCEDTAGGDDSTNWRATKVQIAATAAWPGETLFHVGGNTCPSYSIQSQQINGSLVDVTNCPANSHFLAIEEDDPDTWEWETDAAGIGEPTNPNDEAVFVTTDASILAEVHSTEGGTFDIPIGFAYHQNLEYTACTHAYQPLLDWYEHDLTVVITH